MEMLRDLLERRLENARRNESDWEEHHSSEQNAFIVHDAGQYYNAMYYSSASSWTLRDTHMFETLSRLLALRPATMRKAIIWAHNSYVGDTRYTAMGSRHNEVNLGQLCRERLYRGNVAIIGCGTHTGTGAAAHKWDENMEVMAVHPSRDDSWEMLAHSTGIPRFLLDIRHGRIDTKLRAAMSAENRLERFIGVIYRPDTERISHYSQSILHEQFHAYVWFDCAESVKPLEVTLL
ncbi:hypothetical protein VN97_g8811 [Penicillium thymicola]|uniref:Erythromycin esterase n=1 Tax=Penicillium thymicola TaxID=293382 RepID=A0AAI9X5V4_PENTH|nr:hypothetical protein VN97_g8811 [Penicillium thymicola]